MYVPNLIIIASPIYWPPITMMMFIVSMKTDDDDNPN